MSNIQKQITDISTIIEALLFVSPEPILQAQLAIVLKASIKEIEEGVKNLETNLLSRGLRITHHGERIQLTTAPEMGEYIEEFLGLEATSRLSHAALETLAIIAYQQPITRPVIEGIRGVNCDGVIHSLLGKEMIQEIGRADGMGRPILYGTTAEFLMYFGINSLSDLPALTIATQNNVNPAMSDEKTT
jgi:segregation and condensation protein B